MDDFRLIPNGVNGIEERVHVLWDEMVHSGLATPAQFVRMMSSGAARTFNIFPEKGSIRPGSDADVIVLDPTAVHTLGAGAHHSRMDTNIYEGRTVTGRVVTTVSRGRLVWHGGELRAERGSGRRIMMRPFGPLFFPRRTEDGD